MSSVFNALDKTPKQYGENNSVEYGWSPDLQEKIVQLSFQLVRTSNVSQKQHLADEFVSIMNTIFTVDNNNEKEKYEYGLVIYKLIAQTRDIIGGKGEYNLSWYLITALAKRDNPIEQKLAADVLKLYVIPTEHTKHPYGSWKDIKYFLNFWKESGMPLNHPIVNNCIRMVDEQLKKDMTSDDPSLCGRWVGRESSKKFGWQTSAFAKAYYSEIMGTVTKGNKEQYTKAKNKCLTLFRKDVLSTLNKKLNTPQCKQCNGEWSNINIEKDVTSNTMRKQRLALQNVTKKGEVRSLNHDRVQCGVNYTKLIAKAKKGEATVKGKRVGLLDMVKDMISLHASHPVSAWKSLDNLEIDALNLQWQDNATQTHRLENMVAMVDTSGSMECDDAVFAAIALGIRIAEKSKLGKRVLTFSSSPDWINLEKCPNLSDMVRELYQRGGWGMNTNFKAALNLMLDSCVEQKVPAHEVAKLTLVILSDMQMDQADYESKGDNTNTLYDNMKVAFARAGLKAVGEPYPVPHVLFWNCRSTNGFPTLSKQTNASMMSGFSPALLNTFTEVGVEALQNCTPWNMLKKSLNNDRYIPMTDAFNRYWERRSKHLQPEKTYSPVLEEYDMMFDIEAKDE